MFKGAGSPGYTTRPEPPCPDAKRSNTERVVLLNINTTVEFHLGLDMSLNHKWNEFGEHVRRGLSSHISQSPVWVLPLGYILFHVRSNGFLVGPAGG